MICDTSLLHSMALDSSVTRSILIYYCLLFFEKFYVSINFPVTVLHEFLTAKRSLVNVINKKSVLFCGSAFYGIHLLTYMSHSSSHSEISFDLIHGITFDTSYFYHIFLCNIPFYHFLGVKHILILMALGPFHIEPQLMLVRVVAFK